MNAIRIHRRRAQAHGIRGTLTGAEWQVHDRRRRR